MLHLHNSGCCLISCCERPRRHCSVIAQNLSRKSVTRELAGPLPCTGDFMSIRVMYYKLFQTEPLKYNMTLTCSIWSSSIAVTRNGMQRQGHVRKPISDAAARRARAVCIANRAAWRGMHIFVWCSAWSKTVMPFAKFWKMEVCQNPPQQHQTRSIFNFGAMSDRQL